jgi:hypothetical protein
MSLDLFRLVHGIDIQHDDLTSNAYILQGVGAPGADGDVQDDAPIGSIYMRTDAISDELQVYYKWKDDNAVSDWRLVASKAYVDAAVQGISWREPVRYLDDSTTSVANALVDMNADDTLGTEGAVAAGDRILFSAMGAGDGGPNVYIVGGTSGNWTLTEDTNDESDGDAVLVNEGTEADAQWIYDGSAWIKFGGAGSASELQYIRDFIGKDGAGVESPNYPSNAIVIDGQSLENEIGRLDHATGDLQFTNDYVLTDYSDNLGSGASGTITDNLDAIDAAFGDGVVAPAGGNYALDGNMVWNGGTETVSTALDALNEGIGDRDYDEENLITDGESVSDSLDALDQGIGDIDNTSAWTTGGYLDNTTAAGNSVQETLDAYNQVIGDIVDDTDENTGSVTAAGPAVVIDTISATDATEVKWILQVKDGSGNRRSMEVHALTDGTNIDWNRYSVLRLGNTGAVGVSVALNGGNIEFSIDPSNNLDYTIKRISKSFL